MCGISCFFARESTPSEKTIDTLLKWGEKRGTDGFGAIIYKRDKQKCESIYSLETYSNIKDSVIKQIREKMEIGDILIAISRAAPETECSTTLNDIQPITNSNCVLAHNGAISNSVLKKLKKDTESIFTFRTDIDSEGILASYIKNGRNIKDAMEEISGGVAAVLLDQIKDRLYIISDFKPVAHSYIKDLGYFVSSDNDCLREIVENQKGASRCGMCLWEDYYYHWLSGQHIYSIDLDSGFQTKINYSPRYIISDKWDSNFSKLDESLDDKELCLVSCSGGLDSTLTLATLKKAGYQNIIACHFKYGHRGQDAEEIAIKKVTEKLDIPLKIFDIEENMRNIDKSSMLIDENCDITTGTSDGLKQLDAWVNGRNMLFLTYMATFAEAQVMNYGYKKINLLGGMMQLTESGCIVDCENNKVLTSKNKYVFPSEVKKGDQLLSFNFDSKKLENTTVQKVFHTIHDKTYKLKLTPDQSCVDFKKEQFVSCEQPYYVKGKGPVRTDQLEVGDILYSFRECVSIQSMSEATLPQNNWIVESLEIIEGKQEMINFYCEPNNNFFINEILTHNSYPDNSEYFLQSCLDMFNYGTLIGNRIKPMYGLSNLMKSDQFMLIDAFNLYDIYYHSISCDRPIIQNGIAKNCSKDRIPACGSGLLSYWGSKLAGMDDMNLRNFYEVEEDYEAYVPQHMENSKPLSKNIREIISRILFPVDRKEVLLEEWKKNQIPPSRS